MFQALRQHLHSIGFPTWRSSLGIVVAAVAFDIWALFEDDLTTIAKIANALGLISFLIIAVRCYGRGGKYHSNAWQFLKWFAPLSVKTALRSWFLLVPFVITYVVVPNENIYLPTLSVLLAFAYAWLLHRAATSELSDGKT